jgi:proline racemase
MAFRRTFNAVDTHSGIPMRVITGGVPHIPGRSVYEKMKWLEKNDDQLRKLMLREPRGYPPHCCNIIVPPGHPEADAGYIIMEQIEYPMMSGGNTISVATVLLEMGIVPMKEPVTDLVLEAPAGLIRVQAECRNGKVKNVTFKNVPAFAAHLDAVIDVPHLGEVTVDVGWGGMFYVIVDMTVQRLATGPGARQRDHADLVDDPAGSRRATACRPSGLSRSRHHRHPDVWSRR